MINLKYMQGIKAYGQVLLLETRLRDKTIFQSFNFPGYTSAKQLYTMFFHIGSTSFGNFIFYTNWVHVENVVLGCILILKSCYIHDLWLFVRHSLNIRLGTNNGVLNALLIFDLQLKIVAF